MQPGRDGERGGKRTSTAVGDGYNRLYRRQPPRNLCQAGKLLLSSPPVAKSGADISARDHSQLTVGDAARIWIEEGKRRDLERSTTDKRKAHYEHHIRDSLGSTPLEELSPLRIDRFITELCSRKCANDSGQTISPAMVKKILASLKGLLRHSERLGYLTRNPAAPITFRMTNRGRRRIRAGQDFPSKDEIRAILANASDRLRPLLLTAALTGLRSSELRGLTWDDVDFDRMTIRVRQRADAWGVIGAPKSEAGEREIPMMPSLASALVNWRGICPRRKGDHGHVSPAYFVFPNGNGNSESHSNIVNRGFNPLQVELGIMALNPRQDGKARGKRARYGLHALRHFFSTYMIECGIPPKRLQVMLGHSTFAMTMDTYGHLFEDSERDRQLMAGADSQLFALQAGLT